jgi:predicted RNase H-like nuclease
LITHDPIKFRAAPARFLNTDWLRLMELNGSETNAIEALSHPDPGMLVYYRRQVTAAGPEALAAEDIYALVEKMIASFRELGASGQSSAMGSIRGRACANPYHRSSGRT